MYCFRIKASEFDENKGYAAEIISILLQNSPESRKIFADADGIDTLLVSLAVTKHHSACNPLSFLVLILMSLLVAVALQEIGST